MLKRTALFSAIVAASSTASLSHAEIEEVLVTATKRTASTQDIAVAVSAITSEKLDQLGVSNFEDYLIQLPGVTAGGSGPGQNTIYIRGVASTTPNLTTAGVAGLAPNVAFYLTSSRSHSLVVTLMFTLRIWSVSKYFLVLRAHYLALAHRLVLFA